MKNIILLIVTILTIYSCATNTQKNDYKDYDEDKNPIEQTEKYIDNLLDGKVKNRNGRTVEVNEKTPFYIYIVCDVTPTLEKILKRREFERTPDGKGYFKVKSKYYSAYFEVLPFEKVLDCLTNGG